MQISGINTFSLIEFPGEVSCVIFTPGCNFRCGFCHNSEFVLPEKIKKLQASFIPKEAILNFLEKRKGKLSGVSICGGESTMQNNLVTFCKDIKSMGFKVKLDTNGRDPKIVQELIDKKLVDYIAMDIKNEIGKFNILAGVELDEKPYLETIKILLNSKIDYEFRTTVIKGVHDEKSIENISSYISGAKAYYLQNYRSGKTLDPKFKGQSFTEIELENFKKISEKYIENVGIRK